METSLVGGLSLFASMYQPNSSCSRAPSEPPHKLLWIHNKNNKRTNIQSESTNLLVRYSYPAPILKYCETGVKAGQQHTFKGTSKQQLFRIGFSWIKGCGKAQKSSSCSTQQSWRPDAVSLQTWFHSPILLPRVCAQHMSRPSPEHSDSKSNICWERPSEQPSRNASQLGEQIAEVKTHAFL